MAQFNFPNSPNTNDTYTANGVTYKWDGVAWRRITTTGAQGNTGAQGAQGAQGSQGAAGAQGAIGAQGATGSTGAQGASGTNGAQGATGPTGAQGVTGAQGAQGAQGHQGATGATGPTGAQGNQGHQGQSGGGGSTGAQGAQGHQGQSGSGGGTGAQGAQGHQGHQGNTGAGGSAGGAGPTGAQGAQGATGSGGGAGPTGAQGAQGSTAGTASQVLITGSNTDSTFRPVFASTYGSSPGNASQLFADGNLAYNASTNVFTAGTFSGSIQTSTISRGVNNGDLGISQEGTGKLNIYRDTQAKNIVPTQDSQFDLGTDAVRWQDVYADNLHGDGSNITNVSNTAARKVRTAENTGTISGNYGSYHNVFNISSFTPNSTNSVFLIVITIGNFYRSSGSGSAWGRMLINDNGTQIDGVEHYFQTNTDSGSKNITIIDTRGGTTARNYGIQLMRGNNNGVPSISNARIMCIEMDPTV